jgi:hypothetical protein
MTRDFSQWPTAESETGIGERIKNEIRPEIALGGLTPNAFAQRTDRTRSIAQIVNHTWVRSIRLTSST